jgi:hypothetical protein
VREQIIQGVRKGEAEEAEKRRKAAEEQQAHETQLRELEAKVLAVAREQLRAEQEEAQRVQRAPEQPQEITPPAQLAPHQEPSAAQSAIPTQTPSNASESSSAAAPSKSVLMTMLEQIPVVPAKPRPAWERLQGFVVTAEYIPERREREIVVLAATVGRRVRYLRKRKAFCKRCVRCYRMAKAFVRDIPWPAGAFIPPLPMRANNLCKLV